MATEGLHGMIAERHLLWCWFVQIVDGNLMIKMAVKDTPALLGNKLKQYYFKVRDTLCRPISPCRARTPLGIR